MYDSMVGMTSNDDTCSFDPFGLGCVGTATATTTVAVPSPLGNSRVQQGKGKGKGTATDTKDDINYDCDKHVQGKAALSPRLIVTAHPSPTDHVTQLKACEAIHIDTRTGTDTDVDMDMDRVVDRAASVPSTSPESFADSADSVDPSRTNNAFRELESLPSSPQHQVADDGADRRDSSNGESQPSLSQLWPGNWLPVDQHHRHYHHHQRRRDAGNRTQQEAPAITPPPHLSRITRHSNSSASTSDSGLRKRTLPPKIMIKLVVHEDVSSVAKLQGEEEGASDVSVQGRVFAQVQSSDAMKNSPFALKPSCRTTGQFRFSPNRIYSMDELDHHSQDENQQHDHHPTTQIVHVPKNEIGFVLVGSYSLTDHVRHMPLLLERKVTLRGRTCRIAVQVRSKLSNQSDLHHITIAVPLPPALDPSTVSITRGNGNFDFLQCTIKWELPFLPKGQSFMVSAQANVCQPPILMNTTSPCNVHFPVLLRCTSSDEQISSLDLEATALHDHPASLTFSTKSTFRLLHRLP